MIFNKIQFNQMYPLNWESNWESVQCRRWPLAPCPPPLPTAAVKNALQGSEVKNKQTKKTASV